MWSLLKRHRILVVVTLICIGLILIGWMVRVQ